jgi:serine/threonine protein kinase
MTATPTPSLEEGTIIDGKWEILSHIATGGKGEVYLARQTNLDRKVAFKTISRAFLESLEATRTRSERNWIASGAKSRSWPSCGTPTCSRYTTTAR